jgi:broad specificity phosphatase PhoE
MKHNAALLRHAETVKNDLDIHGASNLWQLTSAGVMQLDDATRELKRLKNIDGVTFFKTPQAEHFAALVATKTGLVLEHPLSLAPFNLGVANGLSTKQLWQDNPHAAESLSLFRERVVDATRLSIDGAEAADSLENRLLHWWHTEGKTKTNNKVIVGSNSTLLMLTNLFSGNLPTSGRYYCHYIPNGAIRTWETIRTFKLAKSIETEPSWPDLINKRVSSTRGFIQASIHAPAWGKAVGSCIIAPGYFGNSRQGPYALYTRIARELSRRQINTITFDYIGSGESSPATRSFESDLFSLINIADHLVKTGPLLVLGHSMGAAIAAKFKQLRPWTRAIGLAPLVTINALKQGLLNAREIKELTANELCYRQGIVINSQYLRSAETAWVEAREKLDHIIIAGSDVYDPKHVDSASFPKSKISCITDADHNFSKLHTSATLINVIGEHCTEYIAKYTADNFTNIRDQK